MLDIINTTTVILFCSLSFITCLVLGYSFVVISKIEKAVFSEDNSLLLIFFGFTILVSLLSLINIFFRINYLIFIFISIVTLIFFFTKKIQVILKKFFKLRLSYLILIIFISKISMITFFTSDTGYYHVPYVNIITQYKTVFGLTNFFPLYGFNNSNFYFSAYTMASPFFTRGFAIPTILIFLCTFFYLIKKKNKFESYSFFLILLGSHFFYNFKNIGSTAPDFFVNCIAIVIFCEIYFLNKNISKSQSKIDAKLKIILFLLISIFIIKLSTIFFCIAIVVYLSLFYMKNLKTVFFSKFTIITFLILTVFFVKNIFLSGHLLFPIHFLFLDVDWKTPIDISKQISEIIIKFAKSSGNLGLNTNGFNWILNWLKLSDKVFILSIFGSFLLIFINVLFKKNFFNKRNNEQNLLLLVYVSSLLFWFFSAPDIRFSMMANVFLFLIILDLNFVYKEKINSILLIISKIAFILVIIYSVLYSNLINLNSSPDFKYKDGWRQIVNNVKINDFIKIDRFNFISIDGFCWYTKSFCRSHFNDLTNFKLKYIFNKNLMIFFDLK